MPAKGTDKPLGALPTKLSPFSQFSSTSIGVSLPSISLGLRRYSR